MVKNSVVNSIAKSVDINIQLGNQIKEIETDIEKSYKNIIKDMIPYINNIYSKWRPKIGESVVNVDFTEMCAYELNVVSIDGNCVRAKEGDKDSYHSFYLHEKIEDYTVPVFIMPVSTFKEFAEKMKINVLETMRIKNGNYCHEKPDFS